MRSQTSELLNQLSMHGWRMTRVEENPEWWADEMWQLESVWSPVGKSVYVTFLVDPQFEGNRKKGEAVWAIMASSVKPTNRIVEGEFTLSLGQGWRKRLPDFTEFLFVLRNQI